MIFMNLINIVVSTLWITAGALPLEEYKNYYEIHLPSRGLSNYDTLIKDFARVIETFPKYQQHLLRFRIFERSDTSRTEFDEFEVLRLMPTISKMLSKNLIGPNDIPILKAIYGDLWQTIEHESQSLKPNQHPLYRLIANESRLHRRLKKKTICKMSHFKSPSERLLNCVWQLTSDRLHQKHLTSAHRKNNKGGRRKRSFQITRHSDLTAMTAFVNFLNSPIANQDNVDYDFSTGTQASSENPSIYELFQLALEHSRRKKM